MTTPEQPNPEETIGAADAGLIGKIRQGDAEAWQELIEQYEGRLLAYVLQRIHDRALAEDIVQEAFVGLLTSLPNYDARRPLEAYLFSICSYKLTDQLRKAGRRPRLVRPSRSGSSSSLGSEWQVAGRDQRASAHARSDEQRQLEESALRKALSTQIEKWKSKRDWGKLQCIELLLVAGKSNKEVAELLGITEQQVANYKSDFIERTRSLLGRLPLDAEVFPELHSS